jgi:hypothetical protein
VVSLRHSCQIPVQCFKTACDRLLPNRSTHSPVISASLSTLCMPSESYNSTSRLYIPVGASLITVAISVPHRTAGVDKRCCFREEKNATARFVRRRVQAYRQHSLLLYSMFLSVFLQEDQYRTAWEWQCPPVPTSTLHTLRPNERRESGGGGGR